MKDLIAEITKLDQTIDELQEQIRKAYKNGLGDTESIQVLPSGTCVTCS